MDKDLRKVKKAFPHLSDEEAERLYWLTVELLIYTSKSFSECIEIIKKTLSEFKSECIS